jgi:SAM-dependent methyltransferase
MVPSEDGAGLDAFLVIREPEAMSAFDGCSRAVETLRRFPDVSRFFPCGFFPGALIDSRPYITVWEFERAVASCMDCTQLVGKDATVFPPVELRRPSENESALFIGGWAVHSFAGRRRHSRPELAERVPVWAGRVLDVGCGEGVFGASLETRGIRVTGVELNTTAAEAASKVLSHVFSVPLKVCLEDLKTPFDAVVVGDVLEHLEDPVSTLRTLREITRRSGCLVFSVPNASCSSVLAGALRGRWDHALEGVVADDHRVYAGRRGWERIFASGGWRVEEWSPARFDPGVPEPLLPLLSGVLTLEGLQAVQWMGVARPGPVQGAVSICAQTSAGNGRLDPEDPIGSVRRVLAGNEFAEFVVPNALSPESLEPLLSGDLVEGPGVSGVVTGFTPHGIKGRFDGSGIRAQVTPEGEIAPGPVLQGILDEASRRGIRVSEAALRAKSLRCRFTNETA